MRYANRANLPVTNVTGRPARHTARIIKPGAGWSMLWASEGLTFGLRPSALGLRSSTHSTDADFSVNEFHKKQWICRQTSSQ